MNPCALVLLALGAAAPALARADTLLSLLQSASTADVIKSVAWNPDGTEIATIGDAPHVGIWDAKSLRPIRQLETVRGIPGQHCVAFSADGRLLASGIRLVGVWDTATWQQRLTLVGPDIVPSRPQPYGVQSLIFSPDQKMLIVAYQELAKADVPVVAFRLKDGRIEWTHRLEPTIGMPRISTPLTIAGPNEIAFGTGEYAPVNAPAKTPGPKRFSRIAILDASRGEVTRTIDSIHADTPTTLAVSADGRWFATATDTGTFSFGLANQDPIRLWDVASGTLVKELPTEYRSWALAFSPDGKYLVSAQNESPRETTLRVWSLATGEPVQILRTPTSLSACFGLAFSPDGHELAAACGLGLAVFRYRG